MDFKWRLFNEFVKIIYIYVKFGKINFIFKFNYREKWLVVNFVFEIWMGEIFILR